MHHADDQRLRLQTVNINETVMLWTDVIWIWTDTAAAYPEINYYVLCIMSPLAYIIIGFLSICWFLFISVYTFLFVLEMFN